MDRNDDVKAPEAGKKRYEKPNLILYGNLQTLTQNNMVGATVDGPGAAPNHKSA